MIFSRTRTILMALIGLSAAFGATACNALLPASVTNLTAASAENPLKGQPLKWSQKAENLPFEGERACTTWPIENDLNVTATDEQICVKGHVYRLQGAEFGAPGKHSLGISSDGSGDSGLVAGNVGGLEPKGSRKIGTCTDHNMVKSVWEEPYDGCVPNKDPNGKPALTAQSTFLQVGDARWKFPAPEPAAKSAPAK